MGRGLAVNAGALKRAYVANPSVIPQEQPWPCRRFHK